MIRASWLHQADVGPDNSHIPEPRFYAHDLFETPEAFEQARQASGEWFNCLQTAVFCPSGRAELTATHIVHRGRHSLVWRRIRMTLPDYPEVGSEFRFTLSASRETDNGGAFRNDVGTQAWSGHRAFVQLE